MATQTTRWLFTVDDYYAMAKAGILSPDDRVELLDGEIVAMAPIGGRHANCVGQLTDLMSDVGRRALVWVQNPVRLDTGSEPQPDLMLIKRRGYSSAHPGPRDVLLLVEVSETTIDLDRSDKLPLYARAGIPEVWIVNLPDECVEVYTEPAGEGYGASQVVGMEGEVSPTAFTDVSLPVSRIIPA